MIAVIDYGAGNLFSVRNALNALELENVITSDPEVLRQEDKLILPGVGAFPDAMNKLRETGLDQVILAEVEKGKPLLGICLGMQMLFDKSFEFGETSGLGLIPGEVVYMDCPDLKIPHMGWSSVEVENPCPLAEGIKAGDMLYFVHSFKAVTDLAYISLYCEYGGLVPGLVCKGNIFGAQFHPEKSGSVGLKILKNFGEL